MPEPDDQQLLGEFAAANSESAFAALVARHVNLVYSTTLRFSGNPQSAEEISQAVFIILARKAAGLRRGVVLSGWLYQTARLTAANFVKHEMRRQRREQEAYMQSTLTESGSPEWGEIGPLLDEAMGGLGEADRNAVVLKYFENKTAREVAAALELTEAAAHKRINRALEKLRKFFSKRGVVSTTAIIAGAVSANSVHAAPIVLTQTISAVALAKGAAASASTLTLVKGAMKIMAWTKAKITVVTAAALLLAAGGTGLVAYNIYHTIREAYYPNIEGVWEGIMPEGGVGINKGETTSTRIVLKLSKKSGKYAANFDAIDVGRTAVPIFKVAYNFPDIQLIVNPRRNMVYTGKMNGSATRMDFDGVILRKTRSPPTYTPLVEEDFAPRAGSDIQGYWKGAILGPIGASNALPIDLKIAGEPGRTYRAEFDNPMQGADGQPASVTVRGGKIKLVLNSNNGMLSLVMDGSGQELSGSWIQDGQSAPASFKRADYLAELVRQEEQDFSFTSPSDLQGHWKGSWDVVLGKTKVNIRFELDIAKMPDGTYSAALANLDELGNDSPKPASSFEYSPPSVRMSWKWADNTRYEGKLENGKLVGTWFEGGGGFPLVFERQNY